MQYLLKYERLQSHDVLVKNIKFTNVYGQCEVLERTRNDVRYVLILITETMH